MYFPETHKKMTLSAHVRCKSINQAISYPWLCVAHLWVRRNSGGCVSRKPPACCAAWPPLVPGPSSRYMLGGLPTGGSANPTQKQIPQPGAGRTEHGPHGAQLRPPRREAASSLASPKSQPPLLRKSESQLFISTAFLSQILRTSNFVSSTQTLCPPPVPKTQHPDQPPRQRGSVRSSQSVSCCWFIKALAMSLLTFHLRLHQDFTEIQGIATFPCPSLYRRCYRGDLCIPFTLRDKPW